jgi:uncharacterized protein (TIGR02145 family)
MMQYNTADTGDIGTTQGVCPEGWHLPTNKEWFALVIYLGGEDIAGGKLKETGTSQWLSPNSGATNASGFSALDAGALGGMVPNPLDGSPADPTFLLLSEFAEFYTSTATYETTWPPIIPVVWELSYNSGKAVKTWLEFHCGASVRCVKN